MCFIKEHFSILIAHFIIHLVILHFYWKKHGLDWMDSFRIRIKSLYFCMYSCTLYFKCYSSIRNRCMLQLEALYEDIKGYK